MPGSFLFGGAARVRSAGPLAAAVRPAWRSAATSLAAAPRLRFAVTARERANLVAAAEGRAEGRLADWRVLVLVLARIGEDMGLDVAGMFRDSSPHVPPDRANSPAVRLAAALALEHVEVTE